MIISPSVLSLDYTKFNESIEILKKNVEWLHFDVMDGHFVPNLTFGPDILKAFCKACNLFMDVHIMVSDPFFFSEVFAKAGADSITFHFEALDNDVQKCRECILKIKEKYIKAGISIKPGTDVKLIEPLLKDVDMVLVMSVEPGFGGQKFMPNAYEKIKYLDDYRNTNHLNYLIEVDGGVNDKNAYDLKNANVDAIVAGSFVFNGDIQANVDKLNHAQKVEE